MHGGAVDQGERGKVVQGIRIVLGQALKMRPGLTGLVLSLALIVALMPALQLWVLGTLVDDVAQKASVRIEAIIVLGLTLGLSTVVNSIQVPFREKLFMDVSGALLERELAVFVDASPGALADPARQDELRIRRESAESRSRNLLESLINTFVAGVTSIGVGGVLLSVSPLVAVLMSVAALCPLVVMHHIMRVWQRAEEESASQQRIMDDLFTIGSQPKAFDMIVQHSGGRRLTDESMRMWRNVRMLMLRAQRNEAILALGSALLSTVFVIGALLVLLRDPGVSVGDMAIVASSVAALGTLTQLVVWAAGIAQVAQFVGALRAPLGTSTRVGEGPGSESGVEAIEVEGLEFAYRGREDTVLRGINVRFSTNGLTVVTGPNGAGKSTLVKLLVGALRPGRGSVHWMYRDGTRSAPRWMKVGVLHQDEVVLPLSVRDFVCMGSEVSDEAVRGALCDVGLESLMRSVPGILDTRMGEGHSDGTAFSGGQFQRLCLARLLLQDRPVWVLDEPTSAIDAEGDAAFLRLLREVGADKMIVIVSHKPFELADGDEVWHVDEGRVTRRVGLSRNI